MKQFAGRLSKLEEMMSPNEEDLDLAIHPPAIRL